MAAPRPLLESLPRVSRAQCAVAERVARWLAPGTSITVDGLEPVLGRTPSVFVGPARPGSRAPRPTSASASHVVVEHAPTGRRAVLELEAPLAIGLCWLALARELDPSLPGPRPLDRVEQGVLLYLVGRALLSLLGPDLPLTVLGLDPTGAATGGLEVTVPLALRAGPVGGHMLLHLPRLGDLELGGGPRGGAERLGWLDGLRFPLRVLAARTELAAAELIATGPGDLLTLDEIWARPEGGGGWAGELRLRAAWGPPRWSATLSAGGELRVTGWLPVEGGRSGVAHDEELDEGLAPGPEALLEELPLRLTVEVGTVSVSARRALELAPGQTLLLGRRAGDPVAVRAGPRLVARGELVEVEGELGVRLLEVHGPSAR